VLDASLAFFACTRHHGQPSSVQVHQPSASWLSPELQGRTAIPLKKFGALTASAWSEWQRECGTALFEQQERALRALLRRSQWLRGGLRAWAACARRAVAGKLRPEQAARIKALRTFAKRGVWLRSGSTPCHPYLALFLSPVCDLHVRALARRAELAATVKAFQAARAAAADGSRGAVEGKEAETQPEAMRVQLGGLLQEAAKLDELMPLLEPT
jgi:hypothetical protein